jgi:hypothetical protein
MVVALPPRNRSWEHVANRKFPPKFRWLGWAAPCIRFSRLLFTAPLSCPPGEATFANLSPRRSLLRASVSRSPDCGGMPRTIGRERTSVLSRTKASRDRGCMPTCIARKAIRATLHIGTVEQASPCAGRRSMRNGVAFREICSDNSQKVVNHRALSFESTIRKRSTIMGLSASRRRASPDYTRVLRGQVCPEGAS